ncbi:growth arrest and DNA damage-inducible proteins-interacting protein 1 [Harpia harpyja]|uniref:growth arrest and DNA damage-inducible proteins-interacting protein 1 n=1 Tax=Harpia harpyja TaxID=202280 RepID=UPI0022B0A5E5|nr:growth arrest and DNA damage-inducible proteins-interacting protein 1 [Harpia harpyja]
MKSLRYEPSPLPGRPVPFGVPPPPAAAPPPPAPPPPVTSRPGFRPRLQPLTVRHFRRPRKMAAPLGRALAAAAPGRARASLAIAAPARPYRAAPLRRRRGPAPAPSDPADLRAAARRFGRLGEAAGVPAWRLWPDPERLRAAEAEEREWEPPLREMEAALDRREREEARRREERQQLVARSLAAMPARVSAWRQERAQARERAQQEAERRQRLLAEAGLGGAPRPGTPARGSPQAQALLQDLERQQRREEKRRRRQEREEAARSAMAAAEAAAASRPPPGATPQSAGTVSS